MLRANQNILRNYLRQWRVGRINSQDVFRYFDKALDKAIEFREVRNEFPSFIKKYELTSYTNYEKALIEAQKAIEKGQSYTYSKGSSFFKKAIIEIANARAIRSNIQRGLQAVKTLDEAKNLYKRLKNKLDSLWLKKMPSYTLLGNLIKRAEALIKHKKYIQAEALLLSCISNIQTFSTEEELESLKESAIEKLETLLGLAQETHTYSKYCHDPQVPISKIEKVVLELIENGNIKFAQRLMSDITLIMRDRFSFLRILNSQTSLSRTDKKALYENLKEGSWLAGTNFLLRKEIKRQQKNFT